jgi:hypothetical protein
VNRRQLFWFGNIAGGIGIAAGESMAYHSDWFPWTYVGYGIAFTILHAAFCWNNGVR